VSALPHAGGHGPRGACPCSLRLSLWPPKPGRSMEQSLSPITPGREADHLLSSAEPIVCIAASTSQCSFRNCAQFIPACRRRGAGSIYLLYVSTSCLWWQAVASIIGVQSSHALRRNARRTWRPREGSQNVHHTAIRPRSARRAHAGVPWQASTVDPEELHRSGTTPRQGTPRWPHVGGETSQSLYMPRAAMPVHLSYCRLLAIASPHLDARWTLLIGQHTSEIVRGGIP
jgi:hypothetical protein